MTKGYDPTDTSHHFARDRQVCLKCGVSMLQARMERSHCPGVPMSVANLVHTLDERQKAMLEGPASGHAGCASYA